MMKNTILILSILLLWPWEPVWGQNAPLYPTDIVAGRDGRVYISEKRDKRIAVYAEGEAVPAQTIALKGTPTGMAPDGTRLYATTFDTRGELNVIDLDRAEIISRIPVGSGACQPILNKEAGKLYVCNRFENSVSEIDLKAGKVSRTVQVAREPKSAVMSRDGRHLFVANFLPAQRADADHVAASVSVIDLQKFRCIKEIPLANGSNALRGTCITPDGKYVYVCHNLGRYTVPTSQLQQGWMNTSAFSIIDTENLTCMGTVLADEPERGAAGIWSIACTEEQIFITHSGTHELSIIDHPAMLRKFLSCPDKAALAYDLTFLNGLRRRIPLQGNGPRAFCLAEGRVVVPTYFADVLNVLHIPDGRLETVHLNPNRVESDTDRGEKYFNDAQNCFQNWQSCNGCHPGEGRTDGMNWDLMNDGVGNPKNCKSLLLSHATPRCMISGIRENAELAVRAGYRLIQFFDISEEQARCVDEYLKSLRPVPSPYMVNGELSENAKLGKKVFEQLKCGRCHSGPHYTDMKTHIIGEDVEPEKGWDTPTLKEVWRTAPYLFDGRAATMQDVFQVHKHGIDRKISKREMKALTEYVNSL